MIASNSIISNMPEGTFSQDALKPHSSEQISSFSVSSTSPDNKVDSVTEGFFSDVRFRTALDSGKFYCDDSPLHSIPKEFKMDYSRLLEKPFFVGSYDWTTAQTAGSLLYSWDVPRGILTNALARIPFISSAYWRGCIKLIFQLSGTAQHSGTLLVFSAPPSPTATVRTLNAAMLCPHVFLSANQSSTATLEVPFYFPGRLLPCDTSGVSVNVMRFDGANNNNTAVVGVYNLNPLSAPTSGSTTLRFSVYAHFSDLEFYVPKSVPTFITPPGFEAESKVVSNLLDTVAGGLKRASGDFIDQGRKLLTYYTGLHNPNLPTITERMLVTKYNLANTVDAPQFFEKMDSFMDYDRTVNSKIYNSMIDEMDVLHLIRKPQLISVLNFTTTTNAGTLLAVFPMCPFMVPLPSATVARSVPLIQKLYLLSRYWRGSLNLIFQSSQSNFQFFRLQLSRNYSPSVSALTQDPTVDSMSNFPVTAMEFSAGGQVQVCNLPFCAPINQLFCTTDPNLMALQHGTAYLHLITPVVTGASSQTNVSVNVYIQAGPDFQFFGFATNDTMREQTLAREEEQEEPMDFEAESDSVAPFNLSLPEVLMNKPEVASKPAEDSDMRPVVSLRDIMRRMYYCGSLSYANNGESLTVPMENLIVGNSNFGSTHPFSVLLRTFWGFTGDVKVRVQAIGASDFQVKYNPPCAYLNVATGAYGMVPGRGRIIDSYLGPRTVADNVSFCPFTQNCLENILPNLNLKIQDQLAPTTNYNLVSKVVEMVIPCYTPYKFNTTINRNLSASDMTSSSFGNLAFTFPKITSTGIDNNVLLLFWIGAGDSFRCGFNTLDTKLVMNSLGDNILSGDGPDPTEVGQVIPKITDFTKRSWFRITDTLP
jgi:hypothetical protein